MERFIEFDDGVSVEQLKEAVAANGADILILRFSKLTGALKIRVPDKLSKREIRRAFAPHKVRKIYTDFPLQKMPKSPPSANSLATDKRG